MGIQVIGANIVADASGNATVDIGSFNGRLVAIQYTKAGSGAFADTVDFTFTSVRTGQSLFTKSNVTVSTQWAPKMQVQNPSGTDITGAAEYFRLNREKVRCVVAQAGNGGAGRVDIHVED